MTLKHFFSRRMTERHAKGETGTHPRPWRLVIMAAAMTGIISFAAPQKADASNGAIGGAVAMGATTGKGPLGFIFGGRSGGSYKDVLRRHDFQMRMMDRAFEIYRKGEAPNMKRYEKASDFIDVFVTNRLHEYDAEQGAGLSPSRHLYASLKAQAEEQGVYGWRDPRFIQDQARSNAALIAGAKRDRNWALGMGLAGGFVLGGLLASSLRRPGGNGCGPGGKTDNARKKPDEPKSQTSKPPGSA